MSLDEMIAFMKGAKGSYAHEEDRETAQAIIEALERLRDLEV